MRSIDIQITKGKIEGFSIELRENDTPNVMATVGLYTTDNKKISTYMISTKDYYNSKFDLPPEMVQPIVDMTQDLEIIVMRECNKAMGRIAEKTEETLVATKEELNEMKATEATIEETDNKLPF